MLYGRCCKQEKEEICLGWTFGHIMKKIGASVDLCCLKQLMSGNHARGSSVGSYSCITLVLMASHLLSPPANFWRNRDSVSFFLKVLIYSDYHKTYVLTEKKVFLSILKVNLPDLPSVWKTTTKERTLWVFISFLNTFILQVSKSK